MQGAWYDRDEVVDEAGEINHGQTTSQSNLRGSLAVEIFKQDNHIIRFFFFFFNFLTIRSPGTDLFFVF
jgi:hypothetical protein